MKEPRADREMLGADRFPDEILFKSEKDLKKLLREIRKQSYGNLAILGDLTGLNSYVYNLAQGHHADPRLTTLIRLLDAAGYDLIASRRG